MNHTEKERLEILLTSQIERISRKVEKLEKEKATFSNARLIYFVAAVIAIYLIGDALSEVIFWAVFVAISIPFFWLGSRHKKIHELLDGLIFLKQVKQEHLHRMNLNWDELPKPYNPRVDVNHPFADDLNVTGERSVHQLMDTAIFEGGSEKLSQWLLNDEPDLETILERQEIVDELKPLVLFRDRLRVQAHLTRQHASEKDWTMARMQQWLSIKRDINFNTPLTVLSLLALTNIVLGILAILSISKPFVIISFVIYMGYYLNQSDKVKGLYDSAFQLDKLLKRFGGVLLYIEKFGFSGSPRLNQHCETFKNEQDRPSTYLKKISRLASAASIQKNQILWPVLNAIVPWDMYFSKKLELLKPELESKLNIWLDTFYELEALCSIANFASLNPEYIFAKPTLENSDSILEAKEMGHPLIPSEQKVTNNFSVKQQGQIFLITGSNMAGKSTFLRTLGLNLLLCFSGAPVNASAFDTRLVRLFTSINIKDSLNDGLSHFYTEVRRLKSLLDELDKQDSLPLFFFVDEIFKGTNNRERFMGSTAFLKQVASKKGIGLVSTHDLELAHLEKELSQLSNWHFEETIKDDRMYFEYKLKPGPCPTTNALRIMEIEGLPVE